MCCLLMSFPFLWSWGGKDETSLIFFFFLSLYIYIRLKLAAKLEVLVFLHVTMEIKSRQLLWNRLFSSGNIKDQHGLKVYKKKKKKQSVERIRFFCFSNPKLWLTTQILDHTSALWLQQRNKCTLPAAFLFRACSFAFSIKLKQDVILPIAMLTKSQF